MSQRMMRDAAAVGGLTLIGVGAWLFSPAISFIVIGVAMFGLALWGHGRDPR